jgi:hypothetical protein
MNGRAPAARWVAAATAIAVVAVLIALAVRMKLGGDPAVGAVGANATTPQSSSQDPGPSDGDLFDDGAPPDTSAPRAVPSAPPTSRAS